MAKTAGGRRLGLRCPDCGEALQAIRTRYDGGSIVRLRRCRSGHTYRTLERLDQKVLRLRWIARAIARLLSNGKEKETG